MAFTRNGSLGGKMWGSTVSTDPFGSGLPDEAEYPVTSAPDIAAWSENMLFALYDPATDLGLWLHLGSHHSDWHLWEDRNYVYLPGDAGILSLNAFHRTAPELKPGGANTHFRCIEPWRRWKLTCEGYGVHTSLEQMQTGLATLGKMQKFSVDIDVEFVSPVWDAHTSATASGMGGGSMQAQEWATDHYEQMYRATGRVVIDSQTIDFNGYGWRDHSRGPRGSSVSGAWGGHVITGAVYPKSGRTWLLSRYWSTAGEITLEGGCVYVDGKFHYAQVTSTPRLRYLQLRGESQPIGLRWDGGELALTMTTCKSMYTAMTKHMAVGVDFSGPAQIYVLNHGHCEWDGEVGIVYLERSDQLNNFVDDLHFPG